MKPEKVGEINVRVIAKLNLLIEPNTPIYVSRTNLEHMQRKHPEDFAKYGQFLADILKNADYVSKHPKKESIEYIKIFGQGEKEDYVLVAVRGSKQGKYYARTLFVMGQEKVWKYRKKGVLWKIEKP